MSFINGLVFLSERRWCWTKEWKNADEWDDYTSEDDEHAIEEASNQ